MQHGCDLFCIMKGDFEMKLTPKETEFCRQYAVTHDQRAAAARAGYGFPSKSGARLLLREDICEEIERLCAMTARIKAAADGLRRIAFGNVSDAVRLVLSGGENFDTETADLFNVSELKLSKSGGIEVKFYDRIKALEALAELDDCADGSGSAPFIDAIIKGASVLSADTDGDNDEF